MSPRRLFLNFVTLNCERGVYSLRRIDLSSQSFFYPTTPPQQKRLSLPAMKRIRIPPASINFHPNPSPLAENHEWKVHFFGLSENKTICTDNNGLAFLYDAGLRSVLAMPSLHTPKWLPISLSVLDADSERDGGGRRLHIMEKSPRPRPDKEAGQFEAFVYAKPDELYSDKVWRRHSLPLPPSVLEPGGFDETAQIRSHAVLGGGSHLCVSFTGGVGTYCFDTAAGEWSRAGDWRLPIFGKAERVPELSLWFGLNEDDLPCVSDLSGAINGDKPELCGVWRSYHPPDWRRLGTPQFISLGSGRLCVLDFFQTLLEDAHGWDGEPVVDKDLAVFTGLELLACGKDGNGRSRRLRMINHMSRIYDGNESIEALL